VHQGLLLETIMEPDTRFIPALEVKLRTIRMRCRTLRMDIKRQIAELRHCMTVRAEMTQLLRELRQRNKDRKNT
jgi:hypothetical protein